MSNYDKISLIIDGIKCSGAIIFSTLRPNEEKAIISIVIDSIPCVRTGKNGK
jgi:hypothetical protein